MNFLTWLKTHAVKLSGAATAIAGFIQGYPGLNAMLTPTHYAWLMIVIGGLVTLFGALRKGDGNFFASYKTVILGAATTVISFIQGVPQLTNLMSAATYSRLMFALGLLMVVFGILNTVQINSTSPPSTSGPTK